MTDEILGWKLVRKDLTTPRRMGAGPTYYLPGTTVATDGPWTTTGDCPSEPGDGMCVARTIAGAQSGGLPLEVMVLFDDGGAKIRVKRLRVLDPVVDVHRWLRRHGSRANLYGANLSGANLFGANLSGANLSWADLSRAHLSWANLFGANLFGANLSGANLSWADLSRAHLSRADLSGADLSWADLFGAHLSRANLFGANLSRAYADSYTRWPAGFDPAARGVKG